MARKKKQEITIKEFESFKVKLGKYITNTRPPGKSKLEAAAELDTSLSKYYAFEDPVAEQGRQTIPLDLLFRLAKRDKISLSDLIQKIDSMDKKPNTHFEKNSKDKVVQEISEQLLQTSRTEQIYELHTILQEAQSESPKDDPMNTDLELWIIYILKNIGLLKSEKRVELIYSLIKEITQMQKMREIRKDIDLSYNETMIKHAINQFIQHKKREFIESKGMS